MRGFRIAQTRLCLVVGTFVGLQVSVRWHGDRRFRGDGARNVGGCSRIRYADCTSRPRGKSPSLIVMLSTER